MEERKDLVCCVCEDKQSDITRFGYCSNSCSSSAHLICYTCLEKCVRSTTSNKNHTLLCFSSQDCKNSYSERVLSHLPKEVLRLWVRKELKSFGLDGSYLSCPKCNDISVLDCGIKRHQDTVYCPYCSEPICPDCYEAKDKEHECEAKIKSSQSESESDQDSEEDEDSKSKMKKLRGSKAKLKIACENSNLQEFRDSKLIMHCPNPRCFNEELYIRLDQCNDMTCPECAHHWCAVCNGYLGDETPDHWCRDNGDSSPCTTKNCEHCPRWTNGGSEVEIDEILALLEGSEVEN